MDAASLQAHDNSNPLRQEEGAKGEREKASETYPLPLEDYKRYGRQMILDGFGLQGKYTDPRAAVRPLTLFPIPTFNRPFFIHARVNRSSKPLACTYCRCGCRWSGMSRPTIPCSSRSRWVTQLLKSDPLKRPIETPIGKLGIFDADTVDLSNLQRQILHSEATLGTPKAMSAKEALLRFVEPFHLTRPTHPHHSPTE